MGILDCHLLQFLSDLLELKMVVADVVYWQEPGTERLQHAISNGSRHLSVQPGRTPCEVRSVRSVLASIQSMLCTQPTCWRNKRTKWDGPGHSASGGSSVLGFEYAHIRPDRA
jgi:hypothetical protein